MRQTFSVVTSVIAFLISVLGFYFTWWNEEPRLTAVVSGVDKEVSPTDTTASNFRAYVFFDLQLANPGNRPAALLDVEWIILPVRGQKATLQERCERADANPRHAWRKQGRNERGFVPEDQPPLIVEPGKIVAAPIVFPVFIDWTKRVSGSDVDSCFRFTVMDHLGRSRVRSLPAYEIDNGGQAGRALSQRGLKTLRVI